LAVHKKVSASTQNQAFNALLFLFRNVLKIEIGDLSSTIRAKRESKLPVVLTVEEIRQLFSCMKGKQLLITQIIYGAGLRLMERLCNEWDLFGKELVAIDGSNFRASNSKRNNYNVKKLDRHLKYIDEKTNSYLLELEKNDQAQKHRLQRRMPKK
jgi:integrase